jgi:hypothetical protein
VHGQSDQLRLKSLVRQREALDRFAGPPATRALAAYRAAWQRLGEVETTLDDIARRARERVQEAELLRRGLMEIERVDPQSGEDAALRAGRTGSLMPRTCGSRRRPPIWFLPVTWTLPIRGPMSPRCWQRRAGRLIRSGPTTSNWRGSPTASPRSAIWSPIWRRRPLPTLNRSSLTRAGSPPLRSAVRCSKD